MILDGRVSINGTVVSVLGTKADLEKDEIRVEGRLISTETTKVYLMLNKPRGYVTTLDLSRGPLGLICWPAYKRRSFPWGGWIMIQKDCCCSPMTATLPYDSSIHGFRFPRPIG